MSNQSTIRNITVVWMGKPFTAHVNPADEVKKVIEDFLAHNTPVKKEEAGGFQLRRLTDRLKALDPTETVMQNGIQEGDALLLTSAFPHRETRGDKIIAGLVVAYSLAVFLLSMSVLLSIWPKDTAHLPVNGTGAVNFVVRVYTFPYSTESLLLVVMILSGVVGACIYSLYAVSLHLGAYEDFDWSWTAWYFLRPPIGAGLAFILYLLLRAGIITLTAVPQDLNLLGVAGMSALVGLYTEHVVHKLHDVADEIFGTGPGDSPASKSGGGSPPNAPPPVAKKGP